MEESYMLLDKKLSSRFDNPASFETHFGRLVEKESHECQEEPD